jgi:hypothetical protein
VLAAFAAIGLLYLGPYVLRDIKFPVGFDAAYYVRRANAASLDGLSRLGPIRAGSALLMAPLMKASGQNAFTMVTVVTAALSGVAALGAVAMSRAGLRVGPLWAPIIGFLLWAGFGYNGIYIHLDNLLNAALIMSAFAASVGAVSWGGGAVAFALLLAAAGIAHWMFYAFSMVIFFVGVALFTLWSARVGDGEARNPIGSLMASAAGSAAFVGLTFLLPSPQARVRFPERHSVLKLRFYRHLRERYRYFAVPLAALGGFAAWTTRSAPARGRRFMSSLLAAWVAVTVAAGVAQATGLPTAGGRLLNFLFPVPLLAGIGLWWAAGKLAPPTGNPLGRAAAAVLISGVVFAFGALAWDLRYNRVISFEPEAVQQASDSSAYVARFAPDRPVIYLIAPSRRGASHFWDVIRSALPPEQAARASPYGGTVDDFLAGRPSRGLAAGATPNPVAVAIVIGRYNPFDDVAARYPDRVVAPGVLVLPGPAPSALVRPSQAPAVNNSALGLTWSMAIVVAVFLVAGGGWAKALLPADPTFRVLLAPGLGVGAIILAGFAWDLVGLPFGGDRALGPLIVAALLGWGAATLRRILRGPIRPPGFSVSDQSAQPASDR